jgi:hypothetical protein
MRQTRLSRCTTVTVYRDRGPFGASTSRQYKETDHERIVKTEAEAWDAARQYAGRKILEANEQLSRWEKYAALAVEGYNRATAQPAATE